MALCLSRFGSASIVLHGCPHARSLHGHCWIAAGPAGEAGHGTTGSQRPSQATAFAGCAPMWVHIACAVLPTKQRFVWRSMQPDAASQSTWCWGGCCPWLAPGWLAFMESWECFLHIPCTCMHACPPWPVPPVTAIWQGEQRVPLSQALFGKFRDGILKHSV
jgi:hypothetical protein